MGDTKCFEESTVAMLQIIEILDAAALTNSVTSERAWVRSNFHLCAGKRCALFKRWPKQVTTTNRCDGQNTYP